MELKAELLPINLWPPHTASDNRTFRLLLAKRALKPGAHPLASFSFRIVLLLRWAAHIRPKNKILEWESPSGPQVFSIVPLLFLTSNVKKKIVKIKKNYRKFAKIPQIPPLAKAFYRSLRGEKQGIWGANLALFEGTFVGEMPFLI
jgi:hypothetical protein